METCNKCKGEGVILVYNGSINNPVDPEYIKCPECKGRKIVEYVDNPH